MKETKYWLWLTMVFGVGSNRIWQAMCLYETASDAYNSLKNGYSSLKLNDNEIKNIRSASLAKAEEFIESCEKKGIAMLCYSDEEYPKPLRHIYNPPAVLYCLGNVSCLENRRTVTAVGTRNVSDYGAEAAERICRELAEKGILIVSGFALGTDITAHLAAARLRKPTVCVLGCGVDVDYPRGNIGYKQLILNSGGLFISEYPPGTSPHGYNFPKRNRILAALGRVTVVFEASINSGSLITAGIAAEQGRDVFSLPPADIFSGSYTGNAALIRDGAIPLLSSMDILDCFKAGSSVDMEIRSEVYTGISSFLADDDEPSHESLRTEKYKLSESNTLPETIEELENKETEKAPEEKRVDEAEYYDELTEIQKQIVRLLESERLHADVIAGRLEIDPSELMTELTELELLGAISPLPGKIYEISK